MHEDERKLEMYIRYTDIYGNATEVKINSQDFSDIGFTELDFLLETFCKFLHMAGFVGFEKTTLFSKSITEEEDEHLELCLSDYREAMEKCKDCSNYIFGVDCGNCYGGILECENYCAGR